MSKAFIRFPSSAQCLYLNVSAHSIVVNMVSEKTQIKPAYFYCMAFDVVSISVIVWTLEIHMYDPIN